MNRMYTVGAAAGVTCSALAGAVLAEMEPGDSADARLTAATKLALVGGEKQLLEALKADNPDVYSIAQRGLDHLWFTAAGHRAYKMIDEACAAADREDFPAALRLLDELTKKYPGFAEGWNRRGAVLWQTGQFLQSIKDCERALALNPNHYGALQGLGVCHLQLGDVEAACRSLRRALEIAPHEESTRRSLFRCEIFLKQHSSGGSQSGAGPDLI